MFVSFADFHDKTSIKFMKIVDAVEVKLELNLSFKSLESRVLTDVAVILLSARQQKYRHPKTERLYNSTTRPLL